MQFQRRKRADPVHLEAEFVQVGDKIIGSAPWGPPEGGRQKRFMVFTIRAGKIVDMQGFTSRRSAERFAQVDRRGSQPD